MTNQLAATLSVSPVTTRAELEEFIMLPFRLYAKDPNWVAPMLNDHRRELDQDRNPFFDHADACYFLAKRGTRVVGRISAHTDERFNAFHPQGDQGTTGFWGFFECENDPAAAHALFDAAATWLSERGKKATLGPASFTLNDVAGLLVNGFDSPPMIMMSYNPHYYVSLVEASGFAHAQDLFAYRLDASTELPPEIRAFARAAEDDGYTFKHMNRRDYWGEVGRFIEVYNHAWRDNWGFVPMTNAEMHDLARRLRPIIDPSLVVIAERNGEPAGAGITLPNVNEELIRYRGKLGIRGTARLLSRMRRHRWTTCRVVVLGVRAEHRESGVGAHLYADTLETAKRLGYKWGEMSWILESNDEMNAGIRHMGGSIYKTYRMYSRPTI